MKICTKTRLAEDKTILNSMTVEEKEISHHLLTKWIVKRNRPFTLLQDVNARDFIQSLRKSYVPPSPVKIKAIQKLTQKFVKKKMQEEFALVQDTSIHCTSDLWTDSFGKNHYFTITTHWIDKEWVLKCRVLRTKIIVTEKCDNVVLIKEFKKAFTKYGIKTKNIFYNNRLRTKFVESCK